MLPALAARFPLTATIAAMIVWALHFVGVYAAVGLHCGRPPGDASALAAWLLLSTLLALAVAALIGLAAWRVWRRAAGHDGPGAARLRFLAAVAGLLAALATLAIVLTALPILLLTPCAGWGSLP